MFGVLHWQEKHVKIPAEAIDASYENMMQNNPF